MEISFSFAYDKQTIQTNVNDKINCVAEVSVEGKVKNRKRM